MSYSSSHILTSSTDIIQLVVLAVVAPLRPLKPPKSVTHGQCDAGPTYGYLPSHRASPPVDRYQIGSTLLGDRGACVRATCPMLLLESGAAGNRIRGNNPCRISNVIMGSYFIKFNLHGIFLRLTGITPHAFVTRQSVGAARMEFQYNVGVMHTCL